MGLLSLFSRGRAATAVAADAAGEARTRARRRLIGATVLVGVGVIGFPLLFETQPRPIPVDVPIEIPRKDTALPLPSPKQAAKAAAAAASTPASRPASETMITETRADAGREVPAPQEPMPREPASSAAPKSAAAPPKGASAPPKAAETKPAEPKADKPGQTSKADATAKAKSPAEKGAPPEKTPPPTPGGKVAVQLGAYADANVAREMRERAEKLGYKVYTQAVTTDAGLRIRVRVGPYATRDEADKVVGRIKAAGLPAVVVLP